MECSQRSGACWTPWQNINILTNSLLNLNNFIFLNIVAMVTSKLSRDPQWHIRCRMSGKKIQPQKHTSETWAPCMYIFLFFALSLRIKTLLTALLNTQAVIKHVQLANKLNQILNQYFFLSCWITRLFFLHFVF